MQTYIADNVIAYDFNINVTNQYIGSRVDDDLSLSLCAIRNKQCHNTEILVNIIFYFLD